LDRFSFSISKNKQFKPREAKIKLFGLLLTVKLFKNGIIVAFDLAHFPGLIQILGGGPQDLNLGRRPPRSKRLKWIFGGENPKI